jgi:endoglucanase
MRRIGDQPQAIWLGDWMRDVRRETDADVRASPGAGRCRCSWLQHPAPRLRPALRRRRARRRRVPQWSRDLAAGIRAARRRDPGAGRLAAIDCLPLPLQDERYVLMREAVQALKAGGASVYIDAGNGNWQQPGEMANRLRRRGIELADGLRAERSNFHATRVNIAYGERLSAMVGRASTS